MWKDPVVEEIRAIRDEFARQFNYDIEAICRELRTQESQGDREVVVLSPKRIAPAEKPHNTGGKAA